MLFFPVTTLRFTQNISTAGERKQHLPTIRKGTKKLNAYG